MLNKKTSEPSQKTTRILLVDDVSKDVIMVRLMLADVKDALFEVENAETLPDALNRLSEETFDLVLLSLSLKGFTGLSALTKIQEKSSAIPIVTLTSRLEKANGYEAVKQGAQDYLVKGKLDSDLLARVVPYAIERQRVMRDMRKQNEELQRLNALKSEFVSTVSHELRTPLTVILSSSNNLLDGAFGDLSESQNKWVKKINQHSLRLHEMICDILDLSKLQSGKSELRREPIDIAKFIRLSLSNLQVLAKEKKIELKHHLPETPPTVWGDAGRLEQVLTNLVTNAIKFTPAQGTIDVSVKTGEGDLILTVADNGPGIPKEHQDLIFERFRQIRDNTGKTQGSMQGIGLGLAICKEIVDQHHGKIWVESEVGSGSRFHVRIPADLRAEERRAPRVLIVDDDEQICELISATLNAEGCETTVAKNGKHALQILETARSPFDAAFIDLMLPGTSGVDVIKAIRTAQSPTEIAVVTAYPNSDLLFQGMSQGPLTIIPKPFQPSDLVGIIKRRRPAQTESGDRKKAA